jgi:hypothetical protein
MKAIPQRRNHRIAPIALQFAGHTWKIQWLLCILVIVPVSIQAADYVSITVELNSTWQAQTTTNHHTETATCIVGDNDWFISGDFLKNARIDYWLVGSNVIEHKIITSSMYVEQAKEFVSDKILQEKPRSPVLRSYPRAGETFTRVTPWPGRQAFGYGVERALWLAFCSASYLKQDGREIPMPLGHFSQALGYSDKTTLFEHDPRLPKNVQLYATNSQLVCEYEVLGATNFLGRVFPLEFRLIQHGPPASGLARTGVARSVLMGKVKAITIGKPPVLPQKVSERVGKMR